MKRLAVGACAALLLLACGTIKGDRALSGALIGAGVGAVTGGIGVAVGAILGGGAGYVMSPEEINLGTPVWRR